MRILYRILFVVLLCESFLTASNCFILTANINTAATNNYNRESASGSSALILLPISDSEKISEKKINFDACGYIFAPTKNITISSSGFQNSESTINRINPGVTKTLISEYIQATNFVTLNSRGKIWQNQSKKTC